MQTRPAVFLDRDGVVIEEVEYLAEVGQVRLIPGAAAGIAALNARGIPVVVATNQAGVARGLFPEGRVGQVHAQLARLLAAEGARVDAWYYCPHHPTAGEGAYRVSCACRKPLPGMLLQAAREWGIDLARSFMVGDKRSDLEAGARAGCRSVLVETGYGHSIGDDELARGDYRLLGRAPDLAGAVSLCLAGLGGASEG
jgi:D-glycero-D-manno-heptose 1,7-bisphosphate phosphatase